MIEIMFNIFLSNGLTLFIVVTIFVLFLGTIIFEKRHSQKGKSRLDEELSLFKSINQKLKNKESLSSEERVIKYQYFSSLKNKGDYTLLSNYPHLVSTKPSISPYRFMTSILTTIGVIGTFLGIVIGLSGIQEKLTAGSAEMFEGVKTLLGGMDTAFITSLVGLFFSTVLVFVLRHFEKKNTQYFYNTRDQFNKLFRPETFADFLDSFTGDAQNEVVEKQLQAAEKSALASESLLQMGDSLEKAAGNFDADKIGMHISQSLDNIFTTKMVPVFSEISTELKSLREIKQDNGEKVIQAIMTQLRSEVIEPLSAQISETSDLVKDSTSAVTKLHDELGGIATKLATAVSTIQVFQKETLEQLKEFSGDLRHILGGFQSDTKIILEGVADQLDSAVKLSVEAMSEQKTAFQESAAQAANTFSGIKSELEQSLDKQSQIQKNMLDKTAERVHVIMLDSQKTNKEQADILKQVGDTATDLMNNARVNLSDTLSNVDSVLMETKNTVTEQLDNFRMTYQESLNIFFTEQNNLLENTLGQQRDGLAQVVDNCNTVFIEEYTRRKEIGVDLTANVLQMQQSTETVNNLIQAVQLMESAHLNQMEQTSKTIGLQVAKLEKAYSGSSNLFSELLQQIPSELNQYFETANNSHENFFSKMDEASAKIHNRLLQSAEYLVSAETQRKILSRNGKV